MGSNSQFKPLRKIAMFFVFIAALASCAFTHASESKTVPPTQAGHEKLSNAAEAYVHLGLELGQYDKDYVDAYLGPKEWHQQAKSNARPKAMLAANIAALLEQLKAMSFSEGESAVRHKALLRNVRAMDVRARMVNGEKFSFADEAWLIYDVVLPRFDFAEFDDVLSEIDALLPGEGNLASRVDAFRSSFDIPAAKLGQVIETAIAECRSRSKAHIAMPEAESFTLEYVTGKTWSGYNWYQGENISLMQINQDFPTKIDSAVRLGCHEGYPGHHVWNVLIEEELIKKKGWVEFNLYPLFSPYGLIAEGSAEVGVGLAFPEQERTEFERKILFPMAGLDAANAGLLDQINVLVGKLKYSRIAIGQLYRDGDISKQEAIEKTIKYSLVSPKRAESMMGFLEQYGAYVLNYSIGEQLIDAYIDRMSSTDDERWANFKQLLTQLSTASDLVEQ